MLPLFIFDADIIDKLEYKKDKRISFIYDQVKRIKKEFEAKVSSLLVKCGRPCAKEKPATLLWMPECIN